MGSVIFPVQLVGLPGALRGEKNSQEIGGNLNPDPLASGSPTLDHPGSGMYQEWAEPFPVAASGSCSLQLVPGARAGFGMSAYAPEVWFHRAPAPAPAPCGTSGTKENQLS